MSKITEFFKNHWKKVLTILVIAAGALIPLAVKLTTLDPNDPQAPDVCRQSCQEAAHAVCVGTCAGITEDATNAPH